MQRIWIALFLLIAPASLVPGLTIETAYTRYYEEGDIRPIGQYFGGQLAGQGFRTVIASQPDSPGGQYFIAQLRDTRTGQAGSARMTLYTTESKDPFTWSWDLSGIALDRWIYLGLTGSDWPEEAVQPLAWHIELLDSAGKVVAEWKSFLWGQP